MKYGYVSFEFYIFLLIALIAYYSIKPLNRWVVLLFSSIFFYITSSLSIVSCLVFLCTIIFSYAFSLLINYLKHQTAISPHYLKLLLIISVLVILSPLLIMKILAMSTPSSLIFPIGVSYYSLQIVSYLIDIYRDKTTIEKNIFKYTLYISFFPYIIQGPISRHSSTQSELFDKHDYNPDNFMHGIQLIIWGFFLKLLIADKARIVVDNIFNNSSMYSGMYVLLAAILYSFQLYTDFSSCVTFSRGFSLLFGIKITNNFSHPYFSLSIKDFWSRWHISLSSWLRDYIYIPLGGNQRGKLRKYINIYITFLISGFWHGLNFSFILWGSLHAIYQIVGDFTTNLQKNIYKFLRIDFTSITGKIIRCIFTFFLVTIAWIVFRANTLYEGLRMYKRLFRFNNFYILFNNDIYKLGLSSSEFNILLFSILILIIISHLQEQGISLSTWVSKQCLIVRWTIYIFTICFILIFGTYGYGFEAKDFIYGGF